MEIAPPGVSNPSFLRLIESADPVVQSVMLALAFASLLCWAVSFEKLLRYLAFRQQLSGLEKAVIHSQPMSGWLGKRFLQLIEQEKREPSETQAGFQDRLEKTLAMDISVQLRRLQSGLAVLATLGSTAPFVGLFGTVWGIMNSFTGIAAAKDTSLAVVAPGIAEALLAT